ncbi:acyltransferase [Lutimonas saemankumensis]|uniref:acyltransferase n=1 Tax=Lutimonas saemankumensis TaxID=483016 RepID=UPI001CD4106B|nr:acyltransferase [Lutimonas saemankumensis]MCA0931599.1 acyltransferase [Lutimonas saemankumensis]
MRKCGRNFQITHNAKITALTGLEIGDDVFIGNNTMIMGLEIKIGNKVLIGPNTVLVTTHHKFDGDSFRSFSIDSDPILVDDGSWIGANCTVLRGSIIPERSILAAGSVLSKKMTKSFSIYGGVPAKHLNYLNH